MNEITNDNLNDRHNDRHNDSLSRREVVGRFGVGVAAMAVSAVLAESDGRSARAAEAAATARLDNQVDKYPKPPFPEQESPGLVSPAK